MLPSVAVYTGYKQFKCFSDIHIFSDKGATDESGIVQRPCENALSSYLLLHEL